MRSIAVYHCLATTMCPYEHKHCVLAKQRKCMTYERGVMDLHPTTIAATNAGYPYSHVEQLFRWTVIKILTHSDLGDIAIGKFIVDLLCMRERI